MRTKCSKEALDETYRRKEIIEQKWKKPKLREILLQVNISACNYIQT
jgi:hypothetical protein